MAFANGQNVQASDLNNFSVDTVTTSGAVVAGTTLAVGTTMTVASTGATAIDVAGGITAGTGNVGIVDTTGKIPAISSTYVASLVGTALTGIPVLLYANSGSTTAAGAENVDTLAITGLTAKDTLKIYISFQSVTQDTASVNLRNVTDTVTITDVWDSGAGPCPAGTAQTNEITIRQYQSAATAIGSMSMYRNAAAGAIIGGNSTFTTNWTGAWTIGLRQGGVTAGGTFRWSWSIFKVAGQ